MRDIIASLVLMDGYLDKLLEVFDKCEALGDTPSLHKLFEIFKHIGVQRQAHPLT